MRRAERASTRAAATGLLAIGALHVVWATGSSWPMGSRRLLSDAVVGSEEDRVPSAAACLSVAGLLGAAAALVDGRPRGLPRVSRAGAAAVVGTLCARGGLGLAGRTDVLSPLAVSARFRRNDRRIYSPLCLTLAALAAPAARGHRGLAGTR